MSTQVPARGLNYAHPPMHPTSCTHSLVSRYGSDSFVVLKATPDSNYEKLIIFSWIKKAVIKAMLNNEGDMIENIILYIYYIYETEGGQQQLELARLNVGVVVWGCVFTTSG